MSPDPFAGISGMEALDDADPPDYGKWLPIRFWSKVNRTDTCWLWTAYCNRAGYGRYWHESVQQMAHRVSYEVLVGPIPPGLELDHLCRVTNCVNPSHLESVTHKVNVERGEGLAALARTWVGKTACKRGHPRTEENTAWKPNGTRRCVPCERMWSLRAYYARKEQAL
jgi:hypothetical protein